MTETQTQPEISLMPAGRLQLKPALSSDLPLLLGMMQDFYALEGMVYNPDVEAAIETLLSHPHDGRVWLVLDGETAIGYTVITFWFSLEFRGKAAFLDEIYLEPDYRSKGHGPEIIEALAGFCRPLGIRTLRLEVEHENLRAQKAYQRSGFSTHPRHLMTKWL